MDSARYGITNPSEPVLHELPDIRCGDSMVPVRVVIRKAEDGVWRGRILFGPGEPADALSTAEVFCAPSEPELWRAVWDLRTHHLQHLFRSLTE